MPDEQAKETAADKKTERFRIRPAHAAIAAIAIAATAIICAVALSGSGKAGAPTGMAIGNVTFGLAPEQIAEFGRIAAECNQYIAQADNGNIMGCLNNYSLALKNANMADSALVRYANATKLDANYLLAMNLRGILFQKLGLFNESRQEFEKALVIEPDNTVLLMNRANLLAEMGLKAEAEEGFRKAIGIAPEDKSIYRNFAQFLYANGRYAEAKDALEKSA